MQSTADLLDGIPVLPFNDPLLVKSFLSQNPALGNVLAFKRLKQAIINGEEDDIILFRVGSTEFLFALLVEDWPEHLLELQRYFVSTEEYENAAECRRLHTRLMIEWVIADSCEEAA